MAVMPNYTLSRTSPPANIYERKINLGYGLKVDTSDAPKALADAPPNPKERKMNAQVMDMADQPTVVDPGFADGTVFIQQDGDYPNPDAALEAEEAETEAAKEVTLN